MCDNKCHGCGLDTEKCFYGGDCLEVQAIYREQQKEKLADIDPDEVECDMCGYTYGEKSHDHCRW